jgi:hypothetical protein
MHKRIDLDKLDLSSLSKTPQPNTSQEAKTPATGISEESLAIILAALSASNQAPNTVVVGQPTSRRKNEQRGISGVAASAVAIASLGVGVVGMHVWKNTSGDSRQRYEQATDILRDELEDAGILEPREVWEGGDIPPRHLRTNYADTTSAAASRQGEEICFEASYQQTCVVNVGPTQEITSEQGDVYKIAAYVLEVALYKGGTRITDSNEAVELFDAASSDAAYRSALDGAECAATGNAQGAQTAYVFSNSEQAAVLLGLVGDEEECNG